MKATRDMVRAAEDAVADYCRERERDGTVVHPNVLAELAVEAAVRAYNARVGREVEIPLGPIA